MRGDRAGWNELPFEDRDGIMVAYEASAAHGCKSVEDTHSDDIPLHLRGTLQLSVSLLGSGCVFFWGEQVQHACTVQHRTSYYARLYDV